jgi:hypothetical protein
MPKPPATPEGVPPVVLGVPAVVLVDPEAEPPVAGVEPAVLLPLLPKPLKPLVGSSEQPPLAAMQARPKVLRTTVFRTVCFTGALLRLRRLHVQPSSAPSQKFESERKRAELQS